VVAPRVGRPVLGEDAVVLAKGHALLEAAARGAARGAFADGPHHLSMLFEGAPISMGEAANPVDCGRIVEAVGAQGVPENV